MSGLGLGRRLGRVALGAHRNRPPFAPRESGGGGAGSVVERDPAAVGLWVGKIRLGHPAPGCAGGIAREIEHSPHRGHPVPLHRDGEERPPRVTSRLARGNHGASATASPAGSASQPPRQAVTTWPLNVATSAPRPPPRPRSRTPDSRRSGSTTRPAAGRRSPAGAPLRRSRQASAASRVVKIAASISSTSPKNCCQAPMRARPGPARFRAVGSCSFASGWLASRR